MKRDDILDSVESTIDPLIVAAKNDVDRTLFTETLSMTPGERIDAAYRFAVELARFRPVIRAPSESR